MNFEYNPVRGTQGNTLHKVIRSDGLQMGNFGSAGAAIYMATYLNDQAERNVGNAHKLRNDTAPTTPQSNVRGMYVVAYGSKDHGDHIMYLEVARHYYGSSWLTRRRAIVFKNFARKFHPQQRRKLTFCVEYVK